MKWRLIMEKTYIFTDNDSPIPENVHADHFINTFCADSHYRQGLCCKMAREYDIFMESEKRWFCHVDDDNYVNVPALVGFLQQYNHSDDWYLGRPSISHSMEVLDRANPGQKLAFWFATGGAGFCISRGLADKMVPHAGGGRIMTTGGIIRLPDDCTEGYIINHLLKVPLTKIKEFHSHLEGLHRIPQHQLSDQLTLSYFNSNVIDVKGYSHENDPTRFKTVHCHLYPYLSQCVDMPRWLPVLYSVHLYLLASDITIVLLLKCCCKTLYLYYRFKSFCKCIMHKQNNFNEINKR